MRACRHSATLAAALLLLLGGSAAARADAPEAPEAAALEATLHDWLAALFGPRMALGARPVQLTPQGDHFDLAVPIAGAVGETGIRLDGPALTATARRLDGGRWALDGIRLPSPLRIDVPAPQGENVWTVTMQDQVQHAVLDPTLATTSTWDGSIGGYTSEWHGPGGSRRSEAAHVRTHIAWQPAGGGRIDVTETASSDLLTSNMRDDRLGLVAFSAGHAQVLAHVAALAPSRLPALLQSALDLAPLLLTTAGDATAAPHASPRLTPELRAALARMLDAAGDLLGGFGEQVVFRNVLVRGHDFDAAMQSVELGAKVSAPDGHVRLRLHVAMDGLDSGALPSGRLRAYVPSHIALTPWLSGLSAARLRALLSAALAAGGSNDPALATQARALVREGPLSAGIDDLAADLGPATLAASGEARVIGPDQIAGQARIRITGLDALIRDARGEPALRQVLPVLIFLKGIGEAEGPATVWNLAYDGGRLSVNGTDLSQMMPGK